MYLQAHLTIIAGPGYNVATGDSPSHCTDALFTSVKYLTRESCSKKKFAKQTGQLVPFKNRLSFSLETHDKCVCTGKIDYNSLNNTSGQPVLRTE